MNTNKKGTHNNQKDPGTTFSSITRSDSHGLRAVLEIAFIANVGYSSIRIGNVLFKHGLKLGIAPLRNAAEKIVHFFLARWATRLVPTDGCFRGVANVFQVPVHSVNNDLRIGVRFVGNKGIRSRRRAVVANVSAGSVAFVCTLTGCQGLFERRAIWNCGILSC